MAHSGNFNHKSVCVNQPMSSKSHGARSMILNYLKSPSSDGLLCSCLSASNHNAPICALWSIWHLPESGSVGWNWPFEVALMPPWQQDAKIRNLLHTCLANHQRRRGALCENNHISSTPLWLLQSQESQLWRDSTSYKADQLQKSRLRPFLTFFIFGVVITSIILVVLLVVFVLLFFVVVILLR